MSGDAPLLDVRGLGKTFDVRGGVIPRVIARVHALDDVSFSLGRNEVLGVAGESGSGKTTLGRVLLRLVEPTAGQIWFAGEDVTRFDARGLRAFRRRAQIIFQDPFASLNPRMTVERIIAEPLRVQRLCADPTALRARVGELMDMVALAPEYAGRLPDELSGGQRQRVGIARALAVNPELVVADEPVSSLDVSIQAQIINLLEDLKERLHLSMLFISHDIAVMEYLSDRIAVVYLGRLMEIGPRQRICTEPRHPYTEALLSAVPGQGSRRRRIVLQGDLPNPASPPSGCVFRTRCPYAVPECALERPPLREVAPGHLRACIRDDVP